ncbi:hypothetical protein BDB01DRAFT_737419 [Pilobolus umbonatus]|nr:hypothetical protein BDB01DRAFT_737419 [Pilobolus umbonatus]
MRNTVSTYKKVFSKHDKDDKGKLDDQQLYEALIELGIPVNISDMDDIFDSIGLKKERMLGIDDFIEVVMELKSTVVEKNVEEEEEEHEDIAWKAFQLLADPDLGGIPLDRLYAVCEKQNEHWTKEQIKQMMNAADTNNDGLIDYEEFRVVCKKTGLIE